MMKRPLGAKENFMSAVNKQENGCWLWLASTTSKGYGKVYYQGVLRGAHEVSYIFYIGIIPAGKIVRHSCHVKKCVNPAHLVAGTYKDNMQDEKSKGRRLGREIIISDTVVFEVYKLYLNKLSQKEIAYKLGLVRGTIQALISGKIRKELHSKFEEEYGKLIVTKRTLVPIDIQEMRNLYKTGMSQSSIAKLYNISSSHAGAIVTNQRHPLIVRGDL